MTVAATSADAGALLAMLRRVGAETECEVSGGSMGRAIPDGAVVRIKFDGGASAREGDAVAFWLDGAHLTIHRLIARGRGVRARGHVVTLGDGNLFPEAPLPVAALFGTVVALRVGGGEWSTVPPCTRASRRARLTATVSCEAIWLALEFHPAAGAALKKLIILGLTPIVWLRPYDRSRRPAAAILSPVRAGASTG